MWSPLWQFWHILWVRLVRGDWCGKSKARLGWEGNPGSGRATTAILMVWQMSPIRERRCCKVSTARAVGIGSLVLFVMGLC